MEHGTEREGRQSKPFMAHSMSAKHCILKLSDIIHIQTNKFQILLSRVWKKFLCHRCRAVDGSLGDNRTNSSAICDKALQDKVCNGDKDVQTATAGQVSTGLIICGGGLFTTELSINRLMDTVHEGFGVLHSQNKLRCYLQMLIVRGFPEGAACVFISVHVCVACVGRSTVCFASPLGGRGRDVHWPRISYTHQKHNNRWINCHCVSNN